MNLTDRLEALRDKDGDEWRIRQEPHSHPDDTTHFTHVEFTSRALGEPVAVRVASHVTPELGELLCLLHNNLDQITRRFTARIPRNSRMSLERRAVLVFALYSG